MGLSITLEPLVLTPPESLSGLKLTEDFSPHFSCPLTKALGGLLNWNIQLGCRWGKTQLVMLPGTCHHMDGVKEGLICCPEDLSAGLRAGSCLQSSSSQRCAEDEGHFLAPGVDASIGASGLGKNPFEGMFCWREGHAAGGGFPMVEVGEDALLAHSLHKGVEVRQNPPAWFCKDSSSCCRSLRLPGFWQHICVLGHFSEGVIG